MIKIFNLALLLLITHTSIFGQYPSDLKTGLYNSLEDLLNNNPIKEGKLIVSHRTITDIQLWGGNDYKVNTDTLDIKKSLVNECFAIFDGDTLFVNGIHINGSKPYCKVENNGRFLIISAGIPSMAKKKSVGYKNSMTQIDAVPIGGAIGGAATGAQLAMIRFYYILDCKNGDLKILSKDFLNKLLINYPDLKSEFEADNKNDNPKEMLKYIGKLNNK
jgi:hypothetical protein